MAFLIAEIGVNHNGDYERARILIHEANRAGFDAVKFQAFNPDMAEDKKYRKLLTDLRLSDAMLCRLANYAASVGIEFMCTPFDEERLEFVVKTLGVKIIKISSQSVTNHRLMAAAIDTNLPLIISTGMANDTQLHVALSKNAFADLRKPVIDRTTLLYCVSKYPTPDVDVDLLQMGRLNIEFGTRVGFSDHTVGMWASVAAAAYGADTIEKHVTFRRDNIGPDHKCSLEIREMASFVKHIRLVQSE